MRPLDGIRVLEVAMYGFVPSAGAVLAEWGADVIKVEHAVTGDPQRGLRQTGMLRVEGDPNPNIEHANRAQAQPRTGHVGARGQGSALRAGPPLGCVPDQLSARRPQEVRHRRRRHPRGEPVDHLRPRKRARPARRGVDKGGYDMTAFWCRAGTAATITPPGCRA